MRLGCQKKGRRRAPIAAICLIATFLGSDAQAEPFIPTNDALVIETLPDAGNRQVQQLRRLQAALTRAPDILDLALRVAQLDIQLGQSETDPRYDGRGEAALAPWISQPNPPLQIRLLRAILRQRVHNFSAALTDLDAVLNADPDNRQARLVRATVHQVRGEFASALEDCAMLGGPSDRTSAICTASVHSVTGEGAASLRELTSALSGGITMQEIPTELWALTIMAETADRLGRDAEAENAFHTALGLGLRDNYLLGAYADFLLDQGRAAEVEALLAQQTQVDPLLLRLALAERALQSPQADAHIAELADRFATARLRGDTSHRREESRFSLDMLGEPTGALKLAEEDWAVQREPADVRVILAAADASKSPSSAAPVLDWLARSKLEDVHLTPYVARLTSH